MKPASLDRAGILRNISWLATGSLLVKPAWFLFLTAVCMRFLSADGYGVMNTALWFMAIAAMVSDFGTSHYAVREVARHRDEAADYFSNLLLVRALVFAPVLIGAVITAWAIGYSGAELLTMMLAGLYSLSNRMAEFCRSFFRAFEILRLESFSVIAEKILVVVGGTVALVTVATPASALAGMTVGMAVLVLLNVWWIHARLAEFSLRRIKRAFVRRAIRDSVPLGFVNLFSVAFVSVGVVVLEIISGESAAGQYGAAYRIVEALQLLPYVVVAAILPRMSALFHEGDHRQFASVLGRSVAGVAGVGLLIALPLSIAGPWVIQLLTSDTSFGPSGPLLSVLSWAFPLTALNMLLTAALIAADEQYYLSVLLGIGTAASIALNVLFVPDYAATATAAVFIGLQVLVAVASLQRYTQVTRAWRTRTA